MGAGQVGGLATLLDIDFKNAAGFIGVESQPTEAQYVVYFLSHAMMFCAGSLIEAHVVLTAASCVFGELRKFDVYGGTHKFITTYGVSRQVEHMAIHRGYNHTMRWESCSPDNIALLMMGKQFMLQVKEQNTEFVMNRLRYGVLAKQAPTVNKNCKFFGWGSRRNGYIVPLLISLRRVDVTIRSSEHCLKMFNWGSKYLCLNTFTCRDGKHGALCPDDLGSALECSGFLRGVMTSQLIDRPCGMGFLDMSKYLKFLTCGVDDSRDILGHDDFMEFEFESSTAPGPSSHAMLSVVIDDLHPRMEGLDVNDPGPPTTPLVQEDDPYEGENKGDSSACLLISSSDNVGPDDFMVDKESNMAPGPSVNKVEENKGKHGDDGT